MLNISAGYCALRAALVYLGWVARDARALFTMYAGALVFVVTLSLLRSVLEGFYYGSARIVKAYTDINMWSDEPWVTLVLFSRILFFVMIAFAVSAKFRADGESWRATAAKSSLICVETVLVYAAGTFVLLTW